MALVRAELLKLRTTRLWIVLPVGAIALTAFYTLPLVQANRVVVVRPDRQRAPLVALLDEVLLHRSHQGTADAAVA